MLDFGCKSIMVVGDTVVDVDHAGRTRRVNRDGGYPLLDVGRPSYRPGAAGNLALALARLGHAVRLVTVTGADEPGRAVRAFLRRAGVRVVRTPLADVSTTRTRVFVGGRAAVRLDGGRPPDAESMRVAVANAAAVDHAPAPVELTVVVDHGGRLVDDRLISVCLAAAGQRGRPVLADTRADPARFAGYDLVQSGRRDGHLADLVQAATGGTAFVRTSAGAVAVCSSGGVRVFACRRRGEVDPVGAGDQFMAVLASLYRPGFLDGHGAAGVVAAAHACAAEVVGRPGAGPLSLCEAFTAASAGDPDLRQADACDNRFALRRLAEAWRPGAAVNGCFDPLHAGHLRLFDEARREAGDAGVLALVNDDVSVGRLKGDGRPLLPWPRGWAPSPACPACGWPFRSRTSRTWSTCCGGSGRPYWSRAPTTAARRRPAWGRAGPAWCWSTAPAATRRRATTCNATRRRPEGGSSVADRDDAPRDRLLAVFTVARDEDVRLPVWLDYYRRQGVPADDLYVLDHDSERAAAVAAAAAARRVPVHHRLGFDMHWLRAVVYRFASFLLCSYRAVAFVDADEFLVAVDPGGGPSSLTGLVGSLAGRTPGGRPWLARARGYEVLHVAGEPPLDWSRPILAQRSTWTPSVTYSKPALFAGQPPTWGLGFHLEAARGAALPVRPDLLLVHAHRADRDLCLDRHRLACSWQWDADDLAAGRTRQARLTEPAQVSAFCAGLLDPYEASRPEPIPEAVRGAF